MYFVVCHDGTAISSIATGNEESDDDKGDSDSDSDVGSDAESSDEEDEVSNVRPIIHRGMIHWFISKGLNVALIDTLEFRDSKVMATIVEGFRNRRVNTSDFDRKIEEARLELDEILFDDAEGEQVKLDEEVDVNDITAGAIRETAAEAKKHINGSEPLSERILVTAHVLSMMLRKENDDHNLALAAAHLLQVVLLEALPLGDRRLPEVDITEGKLYFDEHFGKFADGTRATLDRGGWRTAISALDLKHDVADLLDGRLYRLVLHGMNQNSIDAKRLPSGTREKYEGLLAIVEKLSGESPTLVPIPQLQTKIRLPEENDEENPNDAVLPFSNSVFDKHLASVHLTIQKSSQPTLPAKIFQEVTHWHTTKPIKTPHNMAASNDFYVRRANQRRTAQMGKYAATLTNGKPEIITTSAAGRKAIAAAAGNTASIQPQPTSKQGGKKGQTTAQKKIAETLAQKGDKDKSKNFESWVRVRKDFLDPVTNMEMRYVRTRAYLKDLPSNKADIVGAEVELYGLRMLFGIWIQSCKNAKGKQAPNHGVAALIWDTARRISSLKKGLTKPIADNVNQTLAILGMPPMDFEKNLPVEKLSFDYAIPASDSSALSVGMPARDFQMMHAGPYLDRNMDSAPDPRVSFEPDGWQRKVLDQLDADHSVFVTAPTSAGKTFISFYAMEKILRQDDDGILVYLSPTKALVNQISAEIQGRFTKTYKYPGKTVWAVHTRDYRINNPQNCQILVCVPHVLQIMLLSPSNVSWASKIRTIIYDEIHCIGQAEDGVVWEQLLLMSSCQIIALSATIGNPGMFSSWLASTQASAGLTLETIQHHHRFSELRKFLYVPPKKFDFRSLPDKGRFGTLGLDGVEGLPFVHPVASLLNPARGMPEDFSLEARDCLMLYNAMLKHQKQDYKIPDSLQPSKLLPEKAIAKADIVKWEAQLKQLLADWMRDPNSPFDEIHAEFYQPLLNAEPEALQISEGKFAPGNESEVRSLNDITLENSTLPLLAKLKESNALPALLFNYDRGLCEKVAHAVLDQLVEAENRWKETSPAWKAKMKDYEAWKKKAAKQKPAKAVSKKGPASEETSKAERMQEQANTEVDSMAVSSPNPILFLSQSTAAS